jgi:hypothetical protein
MDVKVTRGMRRRTAELERRACLVTPDTLIAGIDLAKALGGGYSYHGGGRRCDVLRRRSAQPS